MGARRHPPDGERLAYHLLRDIPIERERDLTWQLRQEHGRKISACRCDH